MILIVDDDASVLASLSLLLKQGGYASRTASTPKEAIDKLNRESFQIVLQDMNFSRRTDGEEGLELLAEIKARQPNLPVVLMTAWGSIALAVKGVQAGASDFITKPWTNEQILQTVQTILGLSKTNLSDKTPSREDLDAQYDFSNIIGSDPKLLKVLAVVARVSRTDAPILITGESGTGKELIADAVHRNSLRKDKAFVKVNLGSIPPSLFESELFGHSKGAFTDAKQERKGRFEIAEQGTIFLDEIGDLEFSCQVKLLRVLQDRTFEPVGTSKTLTANVRVVSATNQNLSELITKGGFREDLLYRLNLISVHLPPLRERKGDIPLLAEHFLTLAKKTYRRDELSISPHAMRWLQNRTWQGNIRELRHLIERTILIAAQNILTEEDFTIATAMEQERREKDALPAVGAMTLDEIEKAMIEKAILHYEGNVSKIAEALGLSRAALYRRFEKFGIRL